MILPSKNVKRRALVIGNSLYKTLPSLDHTAQDAEDISTKLINLGFEVTLKTNLHYDQMTLVHNEFLESISEKNIVVLFYAGYGIQWKNQNYLLPINDDDNAIDYILRYQTIHVEKSLRQIMERDPSAIIVFFDISFPEDYASSIRKPFLISNMYAPTGSIIICSNGSCNLADCDSKTNHNGLLTTCVLNHIDAANQSLDEVIHLIHNELSEATRQVKAVNLIDSLVQNRIYLNAYSRHAPLCPTYIDANAKWTQHGITVAGGHGHGYGYNQLFNPWSVYVDDDLSILIADQLNHRILEWKLDSSQSGQVIAGGNGTGDGNHQLSCPTDVLVDHNSDSLIICDRDNRRIVRWPRHNGRIGEVLIADVDCIAITIDSYGHIYVVDDKKHEVRRYEPGKCHGVRVAGGNGRGNRQDQLNEPRYIFVDQQSSVYVSDHGNHRIMMWPIGAHEGHLVAGGRNKENDSMDLCFPQGIIVDQNGSIYVAEGGKHRIVRWTRNESQPHVIVGSSRKGTKSNELNWPFGLCFDRHGNLYVVDVYNHRVQKFHLDA